MANIYHKFYMKDAAWCDVTERIEALRDKISEIRSINMVNAVFGCIYNMDHLYEVEDDCKKAIQKLERKREIIENRIKRDINSVYNVNAIERAWAYYTEDEDWMGREFDRKGYLRGFKF